MIDIDGHVLGNGSTRENRKTQTRCPLTPVQNGKSGPALVGRAGSATAGAMEPGWWVPKIIYVVLISCIRHNGLDWITTKILACQSFGKLKFWPLLSWVSKFVHLSYLPYQNMDKLFAQHLTSILASIQSGPISFRLKAHQAITKTIRQPMIMMR